MRGAVNGMTARVVAHYPEFIEYEPLLFGDQAVFEAAFEEFLGRRSESLTPQERTLAYYVGQAMWRASTKHGIQARGIAVRREMDGEAGDDVRIEVGA